MARAKWLQSIVAVALLTVTALPFAAQRSHAQQSPVDRATATGGRSSFSDAERSTLGAGRLVSHRRIERRGEYVHFGGTSYQTVDRPLAEVWRAAREPSHYRDILPQVESVSVVSRAASEAVVRIEHAYGILRASYHLRVRYEEGAHSVSFDLDPRRPNDVHSARGFMHLTAWPDDPRRTLVSWGILASVDNGLVGGFVRPQLHDWMLRVPTTMRSYLQGRGRTLFLADSGQSTRGRVD
jgi:carbon monoxide dehydrogenase subunit G